jgi:hypothetical protein
MRRLSAAAELNAGVNLGYVRLNTDRLGQMGCARGKGDQVARGKCAAPKKGNEAGWANSRENWDWAHSYI